MSVCKTTERPISSQLPNVLVKGLFLYMKFPNKVKQIIPALTHIEILALTTRSLVLSGTRLLPQKGHFLICNIGFIYVLTGENEILLWLV